MSPPGNPRPEKAKISLHFYTCLMIILAILLYNLGTIAENASRDMYSDGWIPDRM